MTKKRIIGGATALVAALLMTAAAFAQHAGMPGGGPGGHHRGGPGGPGGHGGPLGHLSRELNLTDAQKAQVKQLADSFHEGARALHEQLSQTGGGPFEGLKDGPFDEAAVRAAAQARAAAHVEMEVAHAKMMSQVYALLTAEQKAKLAELRQQHEQRRAERRQTPPDGENF
ncbi:MAG TPA: Spy/CpxP family protein refolding chaperone [Pyrinomonadaceae bacterium]